jgi:Protein of unknown function (DUF2752)
MQTLPAEAKIRPQKNSARLSPGIFAGMVLGATAIGVAAMVYLFDPATHPFYPVCLFHALTGLNCPGCGTTRALYALLHGNLRLALKDNALFILILGLLTVWAAQFAVRKIRCQPMTFNVPPKYLWLAMVAALVFAVVRNLPGFGWLSP